MTAGTANRGVMRGLLDRGWARGVSLLGALALMLLITLQPRALTTADGEPISHGVLMLIMWGMSAGFVHGVGFTPHNRVLRVVLGVLVAWPLLGLGLFFYLRHDSAL
jgi:predicted membrane protein